MERTESLLGLMPRPARVSLTGAFHPVFPRPRRTVADQGQPPGQPCARLGPEGYRLVIGPGGIELAAADAAGYLHGETTLRQLLPADTDSARPCRLPGVIIEDGPRFAWRGLHLDVVRHFFPAARVREAIDWCAAHKLNRFHWHLTDDQGWRMPVGVRPRLAEVSAWRVEADGSRHGGCYTEDEIREVVRHAGDRGVIVVPEIETPGHARAVLAAYPELSCTGQAEPVPHTWGIFDDVFCAGNDAVFDFLEDVLGEVAGLFPGPYIHLGGDEVPKNRWLSCPSCRARMERHGLRTGEELQAWFIGRVARMIRSLGRIAIGWDEILEGTASEPADRSEDVIVMSWRGFDGAIAAARAGRDVIACPTQHCYLDSYQGPVATEPPAFPRDVYLEAAYAFEPVPPELAGTPHEARVLGGQACIWTERILDWDHLGYMAFPRLCAVAESLWTAPERRDYADFLGRMRVHEERLRREGIRPRESRL